MEYINVPSLIYVRNNRILLRYHYHIKDILLYLNYNSVVTYIINKLINCIKMKKTISKSRAIIVYNELLNLSETNQTGSFKLKYAVVRNVRKLEPIVKDLEKSKEMTEAYKQYVSKARETYLAHCEKDGQGNLKLYRDPLNESTILPANAQNGNPKPLDEEHAKSLEAELESLKVECKDAIDHQQELFDGYNKALDEKIEVDIHQISFDEFSTMGSISYRQMSVLEIMLEGSEEYEDDYVETVETVEG